MNHIINALGKYPLVGIVAAVAAMAGYFYWEYLHLTRPAAESKYQPLVLRIALGLTVLSALMIVSRFANVEGL
jgi:H+/Cl- antiporter ClcA